MTGTPHTHEFQRYPDPRDTIPNPSDPRNMNVDGSVNQVMFSLQPADADGQHDRDERNLKIERMIVFIECADKWDADGFGAGDALINGVNISVYDVDDIVHLDLCDGQDIKTNAGWASKCFDVDYISFGKGNNFLSARWTFGHSGAPLTVVRGQYLGITIKDDLTALFDFRCQFQGVATR